jgi:hypothetical protein
MTCADVHYADCPSEAEVRLELRKDEAAQTAAGQAPFHGSSATAFLVAGIQIEDTQSVKFVSYWSIRQYSLRIFIADDACLPN